MPNDSESPPRIPRRRWPLRYVLLFVAGWLALPAVIWLVWGWIESSRLDRTLDALEGRKEPLDVAAFERKPTTPAQEEASHLYAEAGKLVADRSVATADASRVSRLIESLCATPAGAPARASALQESAGFREAVLEGPGTCRTREPVEGCGMGRRRSARAFFDRGDSAADVGAGKRGANRETCV